MRAAEGLVEIETATETEIETATVVEAETRELPVARAQVGRAPAVRAATASPRGRVAARHRGRGLARTAAANPRERAADRPTGTAVEPSAVDREVHHVPLHWHPSPSLLGSSNPGWARRKCFQPR
jgi:hypothetical protein